MAKKDPFKEIMANIDWTRLVPILQPLIIFGLWILFSKVDKRADAVSKLIAIVEPIPTIDLNVPRPVVLASLYHSMEDALEMLEALAEWAGDLPDLVAQLIQGLKADITPDVKPPTSEEIQSFIDKFKGRFGF